MTTDIKLNLTISGLSSLSKEDFKSCIPVSIIRKDTTSPPIYSILPFPKGCFLLDGIFDTLKLNIVIKDVKISDKLLKASAIIVILFRNKPIKILIVNRTLIYLRQF
jgi:hypothetical protein